MWLLLGLFGGVCAFLVGLPILGAAGIAIDAICQYSQHKDDDWKRLR
jgi:hypothetical protein